MSYHDWGQADDLGLAHELCELEAREAPEPTRYGFELPWLAKGSRYQTQRCTHSECLRRNPPRTFGVPALKPHGWPKAELFPVPPEEEPPKEESKKE